MSTGLTHKIQDGSNMSLRSFVLDCVKQFGAGYFASEQGTKNLPLDKAPVLEPSNYHSKKLEEFECAYNKWQEEKKDLDKLKCEYLDEMKRNEESNVKHSKRKAESKVNYLTMLEKVISLEFEDEVYKPLKDFMVKQLNDSIDFDCSDTHPYESNPTFEEWVDAREESLKWSINYHKQELEKEKKHIEENNDYLKGLYKILDKAEPYVEPDEKINR